MYDIIHWLAVHLVETPQTVQKLDQAFQSIEKGDKFECMYALTQPIDELEAQGTSLPEHYQATVDQVCQEAVNLLDSSLKQRTKKSKKQHGGDPFTAFGITDTAWSAVAVGGISLASLILVGIVIWLVRRYRRRQGNIEPQISTQHRPYSHVQDDDTAKIGERGKTRGHVTPAQLAQAGNYPYTPQTPPPVITGSENFPVRIARAQHQQRPEDVVDAYGKKLSPEEIQRQMSTVTHTKRLPPSRAADYGSIPTGLLRPIPPVPQ